MGKLSDLIKWRLRRKVDIHDSYQRVFTTMPGEQVLNHICEVGFMFKSTFVPGDPHQTSLNEGKRMLALSILKFVKKDHAAVLQQIEKQIRQYENPT